MDFIFETAEKIYRTYGFTKIETPVMEYTELFSQSIGNFTDIVQKEMFSFKDRKERNISLRPEGTVGVIRAYVENNLSYNPGIVKLYYCGPMFRAERPQKGRQREFHQFGCEAIGSMNPLLDAEIIEMHVLLLNRLRLKDYYIEINSVGCRTCRKDYNRVLKEFLSRHKEKVCENCQVRAEHNPLRIFDCKNEGCQKAFENAPLLMDYLCKECKEHFEKLQYYLRSKNIEYKINKKLVRGLDYYSKTVFEIKSDLLGAQNALMGGGRYDYLVELLGGQSTPAVGTAPGIERILILMNEKKDDLSIDAHAEKRIYIAYAGNPDEEIKFRIINLLRENDYITLYTYDEKSLKAQLKEADKLNCKFCIIIGEEELKNNQIVIRSLEKGAQENISLDDFCKDSNKFLIK